MTRDEAIAALRASGPWRDWSEAELYSYDYCRSAPEAGLDNEDLRLYRLGLDPDEMSSLEIMIELDKRMAEIQREEEKERHENPGD